MIMQNLYQNDYITATKFVFQFKCRLQCTQTTFANLYFPLNFIQMGKPVANVFGPRRAAQIPKFQVWVLKEAEEKASIATPPPHRKGK